jgi:hypothetical protein
MKKKKFFFINIFKKNKNTIIFNVKGGKRHLHNIGYL